MPARTPENRSLVSRIAAHEKWARTPDATAATAPARAAFLDRFEREVDPEGVLAPQERARRAEHARKAYFTRLALKSARARRKGQRCRRVSSPPTRRSGPPTPGKAAHVTAENNATIRRPAGGPAVADVPRQLRRRREAAGRLPCLPSGLRDPHDDQQEAPLAPRDPFCCASMPLETAAYCAHEGLFCSRHFCARREVAP